MKHLFCLILGLASTHVFADASADYKAAQDKAADQSAEKATIDLEEQSYQGLVALGKNAPDYTYSEGGYLESKNEVCKYVAPESGRKTARQEAADPSLTCLARPQ